jgi:carboxymethylenebutenolidase
MQTRTEWLTLAVEDGTPMRAYAARPEGTPKAGLIVFQEIFGVNGHIRDVTERFAREGYLAVAPELFHRSKPGFETVYTDMAGGREQAQATTDAGLAADVRAAFEWLKGPGGQRKIAAIGYCMGGRVATLAAMSAPLACSVSYYGGGIAPHAFYKVPLLDRIGEIRCPMLFVWGGRDHAIPPDSVEAVKAALRSHHKTFVSAEFSEAEHGFFCDARASYNAAAAAQAWALTLAYLSNHTK